ncbi:PP2C family protein-serine/threonine phosphatase [Rudaeicoccus suwonensis]|uniref:Protein phosphatase n=1 Tax=Rudaeicoccus suwonensis TaxID=657409 RepID=A0A561E466_9MICO|nr:protein phosphatase 2C domain-containing protein [Rudaeicoccus suwonensis]TWE10409.1 protein phosphatase [Rudaeicoccus suwonensis]
MSIALRYAARSNLGLGSKTRNEDSGYAGPDLLILADGMGGHAAGDIASSTVVGELVGLDGESYGADDALQQLSAAVGDANTRLREEMNAEPELDGMGTTLIAFLRSGNMLAMASIGDSRAYLLRDEVFTQITKDHSFVQALLDDGRITPAEAEHHPQRSLVTRVLTGREDDEPDLSLREAKVGDRYLLCSDGLSDYVAGATIEDIVTSGATAADVADQLIAISLKAAARDNVTVVVADVVDSTDTVSTTPQVVGAAAAHAVVPTQEIATPQTPAEKAAALSRAVNAVAEPEPEPEEPVLAEEGETGRFRKLRRWLLALVVVVILVAAAWLGYAATQKQYYIADHNGKVTIYQGISQNLGPIRLHSVDTTTDISVNELPSYDRTRVISRSMTADNRAGALRIIDNLRSDMVDCQTSISDGSGC